MEPKDQIAFGMDLAKQGDIPRARELIAKAVKADPTLKQGWWALAHLLEDEQQRIECVRQVLKLDPENKQAKAKLQELMGVTPPIEARVQAPPIEEVQPPPEQLPPTPVEETPSEEPFLRKPATTQKSRRRRLMTIAVVVLAMILLGTLLIWLFTSGPLQGVFAG